MTVLGSSGEQVDRAAVGASNNGTLRVSRERETQFQFHYLEIKINVQSEIINIFF